MTYRSLTLILSALILGGAIYLTYNALWAEPKADPSDIEVTMYRSEQCNCCVDWADYLEAEGITVADEVVGDLHQIKANKGVPGMMNSCHTAVVDGYVVEGHVPADDILRMVAQQPDAIGIAVPGMPAGSPGMETGHTEPYEVFLFDREQYSVFAEY